MSDLRPTSSILPAASIGVLSLFLWLPAQTHASTAAFTGTVLDVAQRPGDANALCDFTVRIEYFDYISWSHFGSHSKVGETITRKVKPMGTACIINGRLTNVQTFAEAIQPGMWGYFYEDTWLDLFTTPDFQWGEIVGHDPGRKQVALRVHYTHKDVHLDSNPPKTIQAEYDGGTRFRIEENDATAETALVAGRWLQIHQPRPQIVAVRTAAAAFDPKKLQPYKQGIRGSANDLTAPAILRGYRCSEKDRLGVLDVPVEIDVTRRLNNKWQEASLKCGKTTFVLDGKPCPVAIAARPGRHAVLGHYRGDTYPHKIFVSSIGDEIRGTIKSVAGDGNSMLVAVSRDGEKPTDVSVTLSAKAKFWLDGVNVSQADALKRGCDVVIYPERGRTMIAFGENDPTYSADQQAVITLIKNPPAEPPAESMIDPLIQFMCQAETQEAYQAAALVARIGPAAVDPLVKLLRTDRKPASWRAAWALGKMGAAARPAVDDLNEMSRRTQDPKLREMIAEALKEIQ